MHCLNVEAQNSEDFQFWVISQPNVEGFCFNMRLFEAPITVLKSVDHNSQVGQDLGVD